MCRTGCWCWRWRRWGSGLKAVGMGSGPRQRQHVSELYRSKRGTYVWYRSIIGYRATYCWRRLQGEQQRAFRRIQYLYRRVCYLVYRYYVPVCMMQRSGLRRDCQTATSYNITCTQQNAGIFLQFKCNTHYQGPTAVSSNPSVIFFTFSSCVTPSLQQYTAQGADWCSVQIRWVDKTHTSMIVHRTECR